MTSPLRVLMVIHTRWSWELGAPQAQMALADEFRRAGLSVEKFSYEDAFPTRSSGAARGGFLERIAVVVRSNRSFSARVKSFLTRNRGRFDIVDANQTDVPFEKHRLGFDGLLVARSVGLVPAYTDFERWSRSRWPRSEGSREVIHRLLVAPSVLRRRRDGPRSFAYADLINVSNQDDGESLSRDAALAAKTIVLPLGISTARRRQLTNAASPPVARRATRTIAFIGTWNSRKGAEDWPSIVRRVRQQEPTARFLLLGTALSKEKVRAGFAAEDRDYLEVHPSFRSEELPGLLADATVGAFPGYLEGFGIGVLELLAAGLPTITYDAPGPRDIMAKYDSSMMTPRGDVAGFAAGLVDLLRTNEGRYGELSRAALGAADGFLWEDIATATLATYRERLARLRR